jgi:hypothetical protein
MTTPPAVTLSSADDFPLSFPLTFTLKTAQTFPRSGRVEVETIDGTLRSVLTLAPSGGLVLQDPHTVVATLDPLRAFGPSAFGALHVRAIFPPKKHSDDQAATNTAATEDDSSSNWLPLGTLVRLPQLSTLQCPADPTAACTLSGSSLYLIDVIAPTPAFSDPAHVPDGFTGATLTVPHPASAGTLFLKLRDDPDAIDAANIPSPAPAPRPATTAHGRHASPAPATAAAAPAPPADSKSDSTNSDTTSTKPSDTTPVDAETHVHKDGGSQDNTNPTPSPASPKD